MSKARGSASAPRPPNLQFALRDGGFAIRRAAATALLETRLNLFGWAPWIIGVVISAFGYLTVRTATDASSFPLAWSLSAEIGPLSVVLLLFLAASLAHRPQRYDVTELLDSKLVSSEELIFGRWLGMVVAVLTPLGMQYAVTIIGQAVHSKSPVLFLAYLDSFARLLPPVLFFTTFAFCIVTVTRILVLGAGISGLVWFALNFGREHYPAVLRIELSQNRWVFLGLTAAALLAMLAGYRGRRRAKRAPMTYALAGAGALLLLTTGIHAAWATLALPGKGRSAAATDRLRGARRTKDDPLPNFAWTDARGRRVSLAGARGRPALLVFFQPKDGGLVPLLQRLERLRAEFAAERLEVVAICLSLDLNAGAQAAKLAGVSFPVVTEWGMPESGVADPANPPAALARALRISATPRSLLIGEDSRELRNGLPLDEGQWEDLKSRIRAALRGEEDVPENPAGLPAGIPGGHAVIALFRYNLKIVAPTLLWTGILVSLLTALVLFIQFRAPARFDAVAAGSLAEQLIPIIAAFLSAGILDWEMKRGAHELLRAKRRPLWHTVGYRLCVSLTLSLLIGAAILLLLHFGLKRIPVGMLLLAAIPSSLCLALVSLWCRVRLGNAFIGYMVALAAWLANLITGLLGAGLGISVNPLLTLTGYTDRLAADAAGSLETTPYVDWWWVNKLALLVVSLCLFISVTRRVENLVEGD